MAIDYEKELSISAEITADIAQEVRKLGILVDQAVVSATPFDTGRAKSNWLMGVNTPPSGTNESDTDKTGSYSIAQAKAVVDGYPLNELPDLWIVNNLPYIGRLNDGWSAQAGSKYIETAIDQAVSYGR
jgi:hypothetical protein